nr:MAG TPA: hypothetical protein [Caudoviricetes sp.]
MFAHKYLVVRKRQKCPFLEKIFKYLVQEGLKMEFLFFIN